MSNMSFREKSAWISFVLILALAVIYFGRMGAHMFLHVGHPSTFLFPGLVLAVAVLEAVLHFALRMRDPNEARTPRDERELMIALKAKNVAYPVLALCAFAAIGTMHISGTNKFDMAQGILFAIIVGELSRFGAQIMYFRRGVQVAGCAVTNNIKRLRFDHNDMTQQELADTVGVTRQTINAIELGKYSPSLDVAFRIAAVFGVPLEQVFHFTG